MIGIAIDRDNKAHLIDYTHHNGNRYAVCGYVYRAGEIVISIQMDGTVPEVCRNCHEAYKDMYVDDLNDSLRTARGSLVEKRRKRYAEIQHNHMSTQSKYWFLAYREWDRLTTYKYQVNRSPNARKYSDDPKRK